MNATDIAAFLRGNLAQNDGSQADGSQADDSQEDDLTMAPRPATPLGSNGDHPLHQLLDEPDDEDREDALLIATTETASLCTAFFAGEL